MKLTRLVELTDKMVDSPTKKAALVRIVGESQFMSAVRQVAKKRVEPPKAREGKEFVPNMTDAEYEKWRNYRQKVIDESDYEPDKSKPVSFIVDAASMMHAGWQGQKEFADLFGHEKYMQAMGLGEFSEWTDEAFHTALGIEYRPHTTSSSAAEHISKREAQKELRHPEIDKRRR